VIFRKPKFEHLDRYLANKEYDKALTAVADELARNPSQFNLLLRQAEILGMAGDRDRAVKVYRELAEKYARDGFYAKAIALYKKVLRLEPALADVTSELARLIEEDQRSRLPLEERLALDRQPSPPEVVLDLDDTPPEPDAIAPYPDRQAEADRVRNKELEASRLFTAFPEGALEAILASTELRSYAEGDIIVTEGEQGSSLFLIVSGGVKVFTRGERGEHVPLAELGPGDFFGEVSLLTGRPRTATITAKDEVTAIEIARDDVDEIAATHPGVLDVLRSFYERRAQETVEAVITRMRQDTG
jgi:cAMP-dependent protein kinase regulator